MELLFKSIIVAEGGIVPKHHNLLDLARDADVGYSSNQRATLELMTEVLKWSGRYPVPTREEAWDLTTIMYSKGTSSERQTRLLHA